MIASFLIGKFGKAGIIIVVVGLIALLILLTIRHMLNSATAAGQAKAEAEIAKVTDAIRQRMQQARARPVDDDELSRRLREGEF